MSIGTLGTNSIQLISTSLASSVSRETNPPEQVVAAGEALQQEAQDITNSSNGRLGQGHVSESQEQLGD